MTRSGPDDDEGDLFNAALDQPAGAERAAFLDRECGHDQELRARVEALLRAHDSAGGFLDAVGVSDSEPPGASSDAAAIREGPGTRIGRYKLLELVGEGGFAVVYMAEQEEPVRRRVALKIIKLGMDTRAVVARFEAERQALAMMDHPNIAKVFDGGATETGRPYFVMDLVQGVTITTFCSEHRLTTRERIELFTQVCHAVQHAHQKGIIHRDLKPSNILVTMHDDRPVPKVIDFGIAKATEQRLTDKTLFTRFHQFIGTPIYMSPEQTGISGLDVDTRSDIYSLGVLLYELLAGRTPFDEQALMKAGYDEIHRIIREKDPPLPSHRLSSLSPADQTATAQRRRIDRAKLTGELRGDLDRIVMKCLEKDRTRRYDTANGLAADLRRHLNDEPILARPGSAGYRIAKFVRRHSRGVVATAAVTLLLITLVGLYTRRLAAERDRARRESDKSARVTQLLTDLLTGSDPYGSLRSREPTVREVLDAGAERVQKELSAQPDLESEILAVIGHVYQSLGAYDKAEPLLERSLTIARHSTTWKPAQLASILQELGTIAAKRGDYSAARKLFEEALELRLKRFGPESEEVADTLTGLGRVSSYEGSMAQAESHFRDALSICQKKLGEYNRETAARMSDLAHVLRAKGDLDGAEEMFRHALTIDREVLGDENPETGESLANVSLLRSDRGDYAGAVTLLREAIQISRKTLGANHPDVAMMMNDLGYALWGQGKPDEAAPVLEEALASMRIAFHGDHPRMAMSLSYLARVRLAQGNAAAAEPLLREALKIRQHIWADNDWRLAATRSLLGTALTDLARYQEAETMLLAAYRVLKFGKGLEGRTAEETRERLVTLYGAWGQPEKAALYSGQAPK